MSTELIKARSQLSQVKTFLKMDKLIPAVQSVHDALRTIAKTPLLRDEKDEFKRILSEALYNIETNDEYKKTFPLKLNYVPGQEKDLLEQLKSMLEELQNSVVSEARIMIEEFEKRKAEGLDKGQELIDSLQFEDAKKHFDRMLLEFTDDPELKAEIGEKFLKAARYEEAFEFLAQALEDSPGSLHLYNRIGIALRKMGKFESAEQYYLKALEFKDDDPNLYFNFGRLYIDWRKWKKVVYMAEKAIKFAPEFEEAQKMMRFAQKKLDSA